MKRAFFLQDRFAEKYEAIDQHLVKVFEKEGNKESLQKFNNEIKGEWKKDFENYKAGSMKDTDRITYWL